MNNIFKLVEHFIGSLISDGTGISVTDKKKSAAGKVRAVLNVVIYITVFACLIVGLPLSHAYAASRNEESVESYVKTMKEIQNYESELARFIENKEGSKQKGSYLASVESRIDSAKKELIEFLQQKDKILEDIRIEEIRNRKGEKEYLKTKVPKAYFENKEIALKARKVFVENKEPALKANIKQLQEEANIILASFKESRVASEKNIRENIDSAQKRLQNIANDYSRFNAGVRDIRDAVSALDKAKKDDTDESDIASGGENQEGAKYFTVFDIPLGATPQEVAKVLQQKNVELSGYFDADQKTKTIEDMEQALIQDYSTGHHEDKLKEVLGIFDSKKFNFFGFRYQDKQCYLYPSSFDYFHKGDSSPVRIFFEKYYNLYNSQFHVLCKNLPNEMVMNGIASVNILFGSTNGEIPRSFLIGFAINPTSNIISLLTEKYGEPKVYYVSRPWGKDKTEVKLHEYKIKFLKKRYSNSEQREFMNLPRQTFATFEDDLLHRERTPSVLYSEIYPDIYRSIIVNSQLTWFDQLPWFDPFHVYSTYESTSCLFEWNYNDNKILLSASVKLDKSMVMNSEITVLPTDVVFRPNALIYLIPSTAKQLYSMYQEYYKNVVESMKSIQKGGASKF